MTTPQAMGSVIISQMPALTSLGWLPPANSVNFMFLGSLGITDLSGLDQLDNVNGNAFVVDVPALGSVNGLQALTSVSGDLVLDVPNVTSFAPLSSLATVGGSLDLGANSMSDLDGPSALTSLGGLIIQSGVVGAGSGFGAPGNLRITGDVAFNSASNVAAGDWPNIVQIGGELGHRDSVVLTNAGTFSGLTSVGTIRLTNMAALTALPSTPVLASVSNVVVENTGVQQIGCLPGQVVELRLVSNPALDIINCASPQDVASLVVLNPGPAWAGVFWPIQLAPLDNLQVLHNGTLLDGLQTRVANGATVSLVNMHLVDYATVFDGSVTFLASLELRQTNIPDLGVLAGLATVTNAYLVTDNPFLCGSPNADELLALLTPPPTTVDTSLNCQ